jgi:hypothetical protein
MRWFGRWCAVVGAAATLGTGAAAQPVADFYEVHVHATLPAPHGLSFGADGSLFVGRDAAGEQRIQRVPADGGAPAEYGPLPVPAPLGVFVDRDGAFATESGAVVVGGGAAGAGALAAILPSQSEPGPGATLQELAAPGAGLVAPRQIERRGTDLLVVDPGASTIFVFPPGGPLAPLIVSPAGEAPRSLAVGPDGELYVAHADGAIRRYDATGAPAAAPLATGLIGEVALAYPTSGNFLVLLHVVEGGTGQLFALDPEGARLALGEGFPARPGELELGPDGALYLSAPDEGLVYRVSPRLGPYVCYRAKTTPQMAPFPPQSAALVDARGAADAKASKTKAVCNAAIVASEEIGGLLNAETLTRLASYEIRRQPRATPQPVVIVNELGEQRFETAAADRLLVPSSLAGTGAPDPLGGSSVDAFQCYQVRKPRREEFPRRLVEVGDRFGDRFTVRLLSVGKPKHLCLPTSLNGAAPSRPDQLLACYAAKLPRREVSHSFQQIHVTNALATDHLVDMVRPRTPITPSLLPGRLTPTSGEVFVDEGRTRPGEWDLTDSEGPRWSGGGALSEDAESLRTIFGEVPDVPDVPIRRLRMVLAIDIAVNDTREGPGVVMRSFGVPGIEDGTQLSAKAHGKPTDLSTSTDWFVPPAGTMLAELFEGAELVFEADGDGSSEAFAFQIKRWGFEVEVEVASGGQPTGGAEIELCLPSTTP